MSSQKALPSRTADATQGLSQAAKTIKFAENNWTDKLRKRELIGAKFVC